MSRQRAAWVRDEVGRALELLRARMRAAGMTQREVQDKLGWSRAYVSQLLHRQIGLRFEHVFRILEAIGDEGGPPAFFAELYPAARVRPAPPPAPTPPPVPPAPALAKLEGLFAAVAVGLLRRETVEPGELLGALAGRSRGGGPASLRLLHQVAAYGVAGDVRTGRLEVAARLLRHTLLTVEQVARLAGYESAASFRHAFRRSRRLTPSRYRELHTAP